MLSAYLYFINSHQIKCAENGTHFRPNHHAELSLKLYQTLDKELSTQTNSFIIRSLKKNLPSFGDQFTVSVPLTRIRDIAHRNDIPQGLKSEIKNRLQNKLHRSADPGDLRTCEELINRVRSNP
jgi:phosphoglucan,water dikinase